MTRPMRVTRGSSLSLKLSASISRVPSSSSRKASRNAVSLDGAPTTIERNFNIVNGLSPSPTRGWWNRTGPGLVSLIASAMTASNGEITTSNGTVMARSSARLVIGTRRCFAGAMLVTGRMAGSFMVRGLDSGVVRGDGRVARGRAGARARPYPVYSDRYEEH